jgi:tripartite-type tricarboxylate transporter receptor subunit TctC
MISALRTVAGIALVLALAGVHATALAQYPDKPVKIVVPFSAGGFTDSLARIVGQRLQDKWGQPVVIENRPGAGGNIGAEVVAKAPPDGYTLFLATTPTHGVNPALYRGKINFDPVKDFEPIVLMVATPNVLIINPGVPLKSVAELVSTAKADPKRYNYGSTGIGSSVHLQMEQFKSNVGIQMTHIPYKGSSQALTDLMAGSVQVMFDNFLFQLPHIKAGKVKPLAITATKRSPLIPDVPTLQELGIAGFEMGPWFGLAAPAKTPAAILNKVSADVNDVLRMKDVQEKLQGAEIVGGTPQQFAAFIAQELDKWGRLIRALDLKAD